MVHLVSRPEIAAGIPVVNEADPAGGKIEVQVIGVGKSPELWGMGVGTVLLGQPQEPQDSFRGSQEQDQSGEQQAEMRARRPLPSR